MGNIKKEGQLVKSPPESKWKKKSSWHQRYFVLVEIGEEDRLPTCKKKVTDEKRTAVCMYLLYWSKESERKKGDKPLGIIAINPSLCKVDKSGIEYFPHMLEHLIKLTTPNRKFVFSATSKELMDEWFESLSNVVCSESSFDSIYDPIYDTILDFVYLLNGKNKGDGDSSSCCSSETQSSSDSYKELTATEEGNYVDMSPRNANYQHKARSQSDSTAVQTARRPRNNSIQHYDMPRTDNNSTLGIQLLPDGYKEIRFYDVKLVAPSTCIIDFDGDTLEIQTNQLVCKIEKKTTDRYDTKL